MNLNFFNTVRKTEITDALKSIIGGGFPRRELFLVISLASGIAAVGLLKDEVVLIIGSMIVAPLLLPLLSIGVGLAALDWRLSLHAIRSVVIGTGASILFVLPLALLLKNTDYLQETSYYNTIMPSVTSSIVAALAGVVSAFAVSKEGLKDSIAGVAISVSLMPPLAAIGIALGDWDMSALQNVGLQYALNVLIIVLTSALVFRYLDFNDSISTIKKRVQKENKKKASEEKARNLYVTLVSSHFVLIAGIVQFY